MRLNRAVAVAEVDGPGVGLAEIDRLAGVLHGCHAFHSARADLLRRRMGVVSRAARCREDPEHWADKPTTPNACSRSEPRHRRPSCGGYYG
ncbi:MAG TPA: hypothetical protein VFY84_07640 [Jiangellales bacterium]|nr:hypothetical protein [Jiangellales bacterium]